MNETVLLKLKVLVESAVRPVRAWLPWKKKLREELLGHVTGVFEDELPRCADEAAALIQVERRFGNPSELARTLQESVPFRDRFAFYFERWLGPRPGESLFRRAVRHGVASIAAEAAAFVALMPLFPFFWQPDEMGLFLSFAMVFCICFGGLMFMSTLLINGLEQVLFSGIGRARFKACLLVAFSCVSPVLLYFTFVSAMSLAIPDHNPSLGMASLWSILSAAVLFAGILIWLAWELSSDNRYREEWSRLQID